MSSSTAAPLVAPLLELRGVSVSFDGFWALNDLNLSLAPGELRAVIGPNGAGKTTFLDVITGKVRPTKGDVVFRGRSLLGIAEHRIASDDSSSGHRLSLPCERVLAPVNDIGINASGERTVFPFGSKIAIDVIKTSGRRRPGDHSNERLRETSSFIDVGGA